jgi:hypothetical protein
MAEVVAVTRTYELIVWAVPQVNKFPRDHRFGLGDRIISHLYDLLEASYAKDKAAALRDANSKVNTLRYMFRLAKDMQVLSINRYEHGSKHLVEIGKQIGGWRKASGRRSPGRKDAP